MSILPFSTKGPWKLAWYAFAPDRPDIVERVLRWITQSFDRLAAKAEKRRRTTSKVTRNALSCPMARMTNHMRCHFRCVLILTIVHPSRCIVPSPSILAGLRCSTCLHSAFSPQIPLIAPEDGLRCTSYLPHPCAHAVIYRGTTPTTCVPLNTVIVPCMAIPVHKPIGIPTCLQVLQDFRTRHTPDIMIIE